MPTIYDNIKQELYPALGKTLESAFRADFCIGYFNLRGWRLLADKVEEFAGGEGATCRVLVGMHEAPDETLRAALRLLDTDDGLDLPRAAQLRRRVAADFRTQLTYGAPSNQDEATSRQLASKMKRPPQKAPQPSRFKYGRSSPKDGTYAGFT